MVFSFCGNFAAESEIDDEAEMRPIFHEAQCRNRVIILWVFLFNIFFSHNKIRIFIWLLKAPCEMAIWAVVAALQDL